MVLSPGSALPRACTPATPAAKAVDHSGSVSVATSPAAVAMRKKSVP